MGARVAEKLHLSARGLLGRVRKVFEKISGPSKGGQGPDKKISLADCLMSGLALFKLKFPSLLQFDQSRANDAIRANLASLFGSWEELGVSFRAILAKEVST